MQPRIQGKLLLRGMTKVPLLRRVVYRKAVDGLLQAFGGQAKFMGFGGAALPPDVERFLRIGGFPYAIGYGMTECSPLITGSRVEHTRAGSCGTPVAGIELRIADPDPSTGVGEVQVREEVDVRREVADEVPLADLHVVDVEEQLHRGAGDVPKHLGAVAA